MNRADEMERCDVIVLGAGPAGIAAARRLKSKSELSVIVLEARQRVGGRTHTSDELGVGLPLDHGGKWVHGACKGNPILKLIKSRGEEKQCREKTERIKDMPNLTKLVLPTRGEGFGDEKKARAVEISRQGMKACRKIFGKVSKLAEKRDSHDDMSLEEILFKMYPDCVPLEKEEIKDDHIRRRSFYRNLVKTILDNSGTKQFDTTNDGFIDEVVALFNMKIFEFFEGYEGAPIHEISAKYGLDASELPGEDLNVPYGYGELISRLGKPLVDDGTIRLGHKVRYVETRTTSEQQGISESSGREDGVTVQCDLNEGASRKSFYASFCIVALPLGVMKRSLQSNIDVPTFRPPLPKAVAEAIDTLGIAVMDKLEMSFATRWWPEGYDWFNIGSSLPDRSPTYHPFPSFLVESESTSANVEAPNVLVAYLTGDFAKQAERWKDDEIKEKCVMALRQAELSSLFAKGGLVECEVPEPISVNMTRWHSDPFSGGSWTFLAKKSGGLRSLAAFRRDEEVQKRGLFFAGEHTCDGSQRGLDIGSVHGAWLSGELAADQAAEVAHFSRLSQISYEHVAKGKG